MPYQDNAIASREIATGDADEITEFVGKNIAPGIVRPLSRKSAITYKSRFLVGDRFLASHGTMAEGLDLEPLTELDLVMVYLGLSGSMRIDIVGDSRVGNDDTILVSSARTVKRVVFSAAREEVVIGVSADSVRSRMRQMIGFDVQAAFDFLIPVDGRSPLGSALVGFGTSMHWALSGDTLLRSSPIGLRRCKDAFIDLTLCAFGIDKVRSLAGPPPKASYYQVRQAEEFMRVSGCDPIGIGEVADHVGVSVRALQYAFRQHRGTTPIAVLQQIRLEGLREDLRRSSTDSVAVIAARWGFTHLGRMARQYRMAFGEKPSETAIRARIRGLS